MGALIGRDALLGALAALKSVDVDVPEFGGAVRLRELTGAARDQLFTNGTDVKPMEFAARVVALSVVDEAGQQLLTADEWLTGSAEVLARLFDQAQQLNGLKPGAVDAAEKN